MTAVAVTYEEGSVYSFPEILASRSAHFSYTSTETHHFLRTLRYLFVTPRWKLQIQNAVQKLSPHCCATKSLTV